LLDFDLFSLRGLNLERFVDEIAEDLLAQPLDFLRGDLRALGNRQQLQSLIDVRLGDHLAVDDCGRLDDRRHFRAEDLGVLREIQGSGRVGCFRGGRGASILRNRRCGGRQSA